MKPLLLFLAVVTPLWVFSQSIPLKDTAALPVPGSTDEPQNAPPAPNGAVAGRFLVQMLPAAQGNGQLVIRVDSSTGRTWTLEQAPLEEKQPDGALKVTASHYWKACLEPYTLVELKQREASPTETPK